MGTISKWHKISTAGRSNRKDIPLSTSEPFWGGASSSGYITIRFQDQDENQLVTSLNKEEAIKLRDLINNGIDSLNQYEDNPK
jgi:hypothetical protein